jgi:hypothetical protein
MYTLGMCRATFRDALKQYKREDFFEYRDDQNLGNGNFVILRIYCSAQRTKKCMGDTATTKKYGYWKAI